MKKQNIIGKKWDYLIILDACRFDYFEEEYKNYFNSSLEKRKSNGSSTPEWLWSNFTDYYDDIIYYSTNPYINSYGIPLNNFNKQLKDWTAVKHFKEIIDVWDEGWDEEFNTVLPEDLTDLVLNSNEEGKKIVHYLQPHLPYIHPDFKVEYSWGNINKAKGESTDKEEKSMKKLKDVLGKILDNHLKKKQVWWIRDFLNLPPLEHFEQIYQKGLLNHVGFFYKYSLKRALKEVKRLVNNIDGNIIITSDHGEDLGENDLWGHQNGLDLQVLREVPWLELKK